MLRRDPSCLPICHRCLPQFLHRPDSRRPSCRHRLRRHFRRRCLHHRLHPRFRQLLPRLHPRFRQLLPRLHPHDYRGSHFQVCRRLKSRAQLLLRRPYRDPRHLLHYFLKLEKKNIKLEIGKSYLKILKGFIQLY